MAANPRILHLFNRYRFPGGEETAVLRMSEVMRAQGAAVEELFVSSNDWDGPDAPPKWQQPMRAFHNPPTIHQLREAHARHQPDLWLGHNLLPVLSLSTLREAKRQNVPLALYLHNYRPFSTNGALWVNNHLEISGLKRRFTPEIIAGAWQGSVMRTAWMALMLHTAHALGWYRNVSAWIAVSAFVRDRFIEAGVPAEKVHVHAYPFFPRATAPVEAPTGRFLFIGRLTEAKGTRVMLQAWKELRQHLSAEAMPKLIIVGDGELQQEVEASAAASEGSIDYRGSLHGEAKEQAIADCTAMIVPSIWWDPYPTVVYEAFDHGRPVLAARSGGLPESVAHGQRGLIHEPGDAGGLAKDILQFHQQPQVAAAMGRAGREWLLANAGAEHWWQGFMKIRSIIQEQRRACVKA